MHNRELFKDYETSFLRQNSMLNLISKNDEKYLWEKHICDSLAIENVLKKVESGKLKVESRVDFNLPTFHLLDIGTGGGFPSVPIAIAYPNIEVFALDSIRKKINAIENIKSDLGLKNLHTICDRAENIKETFDIVTSRAVAPLKIILNYGIPRLKPNGIFVAYKSLKVNEEIQDAKAVMKKLNCQIVDIIEYNLPLDENFTRNLVVIKKQRKL